jgi:protoporphyrinogen oxidase
MDRDRSITILGGGLAGLVCGYLISKSGFHTKIYEADSNLGGLCRTIWIDNFGFDLGPHVLHAHKLSRESFSVVSNLVQMRKKACFAKTYCENKYFDYPLSLSCLMHLPLFQFSKGFCEYVFSNVRNRKNDGTLESKILPSYGKTFYDLYFRYYNKKLWGLYPAELSADISRRIRPLNLRSFPFCWGYYPIEGIGSIAIELTKEIKRCGGEIFTNFRIDEIKDDTVYISTIPLNELTKLLDFKMTLEYRSMIFVFLRINSSHVLSADWIYYPSEENIFTRIHEPKNFSTTLAPLNMSGVCVEIPCSYNDKVWKMSDEEIVRHVIDDSRKSWLNAEICDAAVHRAKYAYPLLTKNYHQELKKTKTRIEQEIPNVFLLGRQGAFRFSWMHNVLEDSISLVSKITAIKQKKAKKR